MPPLRHHPVLNRPPTLPIFLHYPLERGRERGLLPGSTPASAQLRFIALSAAMASIMAQLLFLSLCLLVIAAHHPLSCHAARHRSGRHRAAPSHAAARAAPKLQLRDDDVLFPNGTGVTRGDFPEGFLFGAITSSMKHEGAAYKDNKTDNIWDVYARHQGASMDGSLPGECGDNYDLYKLDHTLMADLGMNSYRLSIAWSRVYPNGSGQVNELAIAHYNNVINDVLEQGMVPMVTLWTQDHPQALEDLYGGALDSQFITDYVNYADTCFEAFGDRVKYWVTFDEANDWAGLAYSTNQNPPGRCTAGISGQGNMDYGDCSSGNSATEPYIVGRTLLLAHAEAVALYRTKYQSTQNGSLGLALWFRWSEPLTDTVADIEAAQRATDFLVGWFLDPIFFGDYPDSMREIVGSRLPDFTTEEIGKIKGSLDFIGLNIQTAFYVYNADWYTNTTTDKCYYLDWYANTTGEKDGVAIGVGDHDYAVPWCIRKTVEYVSERYSNFPMFITQTGWGIYYDENEDTLDDDQRVEYFMTYYDQLQKAISNGANVLGAYAWSLLDGFEFNLGMRIRVGMYYVDDDYNRYPRKSAKWFQEMLAQNSSTVAEAR